MRLVLQNVDLKRHASLPIAVLDSPFGTRVADSNSLVFDKFRGCREYLRGAILLRSTKIGLGNSHLARFALLGQHCIILSRLDEEQPIATVFLVAKHENGPSVKHLSGIEVLGFRPLQDELLTRSNAMSLRKVLRVVEVILWRNWINLVELLDEHASVVLS